MFRITTPTIALFPEGEGYVGRMVPEGTIISCGDINLGSRFLEVTLDGKHILMVAEDVLERGEKLAQ